MPLGYGASRLRNALAWSAPWDCEKSDAKASPGAIASPSSAMKPSPS
jgi:hypothetical protein